MTPTQSGNDVSVAANGTNETTTTNEESQCYYSKQSFATRALHVGQESTQWTSRAVVPPIVMSTTFEQYGPADHAGFEYGRSGNPTRASLEKCFASLEKAKYGLVYASGLATQLNITQMLESGDHILTGDELYGGTSRYFRTIATKFGLTFSCVDFCNVDEVRNGLKPNTKLAWFESPTNPLLKVTDIAEVCRVIHQQNPSVIIVVDNTFMSPYFQNPLTLGADIVMHSITKYINGHSDIIMGAIATNRDDIYESLKYLQNSCGAVSSPFDCFMVNRGIKTLALRMEQHYKNALAVSRFLESHEMVRKVLYPALESHPQHKIAMKQSSGCSGMVGIYIQGTLETAKSFLSSLKLFTLAESLGAVESLIEIPSLMTHASLPKETREALGIDDTFIRLSVGLENSDDLIQDLDQALKKASAFKH